MEKQGGGGGENHGREKVMVVLTRLEPFLLVKGSRGKNPAEDSTGAPGSRNNKSSGVQLLQNGELHKQSHFSDTKMAYPEDVFCEPVLVGEA